MRLKRLSDIVEPIEVGRDVPSKPGGAPLVRARNRIDRNVAQRLIALGVQSVWVEDELGEGIEPIDPLPTQLRRAAERIAAHSVDNARKSVVGNNSLPGKMIDELTDLASDVAQAVLECPAASVALDCLTTAENYAYTHAVNVATVGLLIGHRVFAIEGWTDWEGRRRTDREQERMTTLGMGLLIHDIGKVGVPEEILNKPEALTVAELAVVRTHPEVGASLLPTATVSSLVITVVRNHHERWDGSGYNTGKAGAEIHPFARICAIAETFDAVISAQYTHDATPPHVGVKVVREGAGTQFDPALVDHFLHVVMPYPVGHEIVLPEGSAGVVVSVDPAQPEYPTVRRSEDGQLRETIMHVVDGVVLDTDVPPPMYSAAANDPIPEI